MSEVDVTRRSIRCVGCGAEFPPIDGPVHRYMESSPACWAAYGEVLAREYSNAAYAAAHRLTVDAYAVQHPGQPSPQSIQSVTLHLISLSLVLEQGVDFDRATVALQWCSHRADELTWLEPPADRGRVTVADVWAAETPDEHEEAVWKWARSAWDAWRAHHRAITGLIERFRL